MLNRAANGPAATREMIVTHSLQHRQQQGPANRTEPKGPRRNYCHREESVSRLRQEQTLRVPGSSLLPMGNDVPFYLSIYSLRCATTPLCYSPPSLRHANLHFRFLPIAERENRTKNAAMEERAVAFLFCHAICIDWKMKHSLHSFHVSFSLFFFFCWPSFSFTWLSVLMDPSWLPARYIYIYISLNYIYTGCVIFCFFFYD